MTSGGWKTLLVPAHPGVQYHFCRVGLPTYFLGHWDQYQYWRPKPPNVHDLLPAYEDAHLDFGPADFARLLDRHSPFAARSARGEPLRYPEGFDLAWLMFNWQFKLFRERREIPKLYRVAKVRELEREEWDELLARDDFAIVSFYPNTVAWVRETFGVDVPYVPLGLDPAGYGPYTGEDVTILSVIHSWKDRGWHYATYLEGTRDLPTLHIDHLDPDKPVQRYDDLQAHFRRARLYLHDGEQEYTITLIEAMMTGMPIVSFRIPGIDRYVVQGENGFVVETAAELRESCRLLLADSALASKMGAASRAMAVRDYSEDRWCHDWNEVLDAFMRTRART